MFSLIVFVFLALISRGFGLTFNRADSKCGYESCNQVKEGFINVHIVPHTHDDVGWLKTVDQYYYGSKTDIQRAGVQYVLDTVMDSLRRDSSRRFMYIETAFFWKWWLEQNDEQKDLVRKFIKNGQLELTGGGWSMNDEGATNYQSIIDQMTLGLRKLNDTFGDCARPRAGWQIDPFGHSKTMANIFALLGYDAFLMNRIDFQDFEHRRQTKTLETVWRSSANSGPESSIFTVVLPKHYNPPPGFCFDVTCNDEPIIDDPNIPDYNVDQRVDDFIRFVEDLMVGQTTNNVLVTMGDDFNYQSAEMWFKNLDKLIKYTNLRQENGSKYHLLYSTASCYVKAVYDESKGNISYTVKQDDFLPYADNEHSYLSGYFTSRPTRKRFEREGNNLLQVCRQLSALTSIDPNEKIESLKESMGVMQHHDAITGTEKQAVAEDYTRMLAIGFTSCEEVVADALNTIVNSQAEFKQQNQFLTCRFLNISQCSLTESEEAFQVTIYNPLSRAVDKLVRLPVSGTAYLVQNSEGEEVINQVIPIPRQVQNVPGREGNAIYDLVFLATDLPPLGFETFYVEKIEGYNVVKPSKSVSQNRATVVDLDEDTGHISGISINGVSIAMTQEFGYYEGFVGSAEDPTTSSGAYVFRPLGPKHSITEKAYLIFNGPVLTEIQQTFNDYVSQIIRIYNDEPFVELSWLVGPIPDDGHHGKEIVSLFQTELNTNSTFYTDSNGREMLKRIKNFRSTWDVQLGEEIAGNYYPVNSKIVLKDEEKNIEFAILTDRSQGGSSLENGEVELMLHRSCLGVDGFGETLQEQAFGEGVVARGSHFIIIGNISGTVEGKTTAAIEQDVVQNKLLDSWIFLSSVNGKTLEEIKADSVLKFSGLKRALPENVQILTLEPWKESTFLLRLEHVLEQNQDPVLSQPVTVDLKDLFATFEIISLRETTLGGNQWLSENERLYFDEDENVEESKRGGTKLTGNTVVHNEIEDDIDNLEITLNPMQIRTFIAAVASVN